MFAAVLALSFSSPAPVNAFGLSKATGEMLVEGLEQTAEAIENTEEIIQGKGHAERKLDEDIDKLADMAVDKAESAAKKGGKKVWDKLEKSEKFGETAQKLGKRWGPAAKKGLKLLGPAGKVVDTAEAGWAVGNAISRYGVQPAMDYYFDEKGREQQEKLLEEAAEIRRQKEVRRQLGEDPAALEPRKPETDEVEKWLQQGSGTASSAADPGGTRPRSVENDPWAPKTPAGGTEQAARAATNDGDEDDLDYGRNPEPTQPAGYNAALDKLETDRRAERSRRQAEGEAERQRQADQQAARAAQERRAQASRAAAAAREAAARERAAEEARRRADQQRLEQSRRNLDMSMRQFNRGLEILQQTRERDERAAQREMVRQQQLEMQRLREMQLQRQLEMQREAEKRRQQARERDRRAYEQQKATQGNLNIGGGSGKTPELLPCWPRCPRRGGVTSSGSVQ